MTATSTTYADRHPGADVTYRYAGARLQWEIMLCNGLRDCTADIAQAQSRMIAFASIHETDPLADIAA